jgi:CHAT domain-containing protein
MGITEPNTPWIRQEIRAVARVVTSPDIRLNGKATAQTLREAGPSSRLIHIATHGVFRRDNPLFSSVRLADSYLTMYDLYQIRLPVKLLTLSGCGTGLSVVTTGDELLGLMRGMLFAGAESLLVTLWDVHDSSTARFMASFYTHLQNHSDSALAMQKAIHELRQRHPHPYYWAPFVLVGRTM